jgi:ABC-2 type transport system permease protein
MRALQGLVKKEFLQVFRDRNMLRMIFLMPVIQLLLMGYVVNTEVKRLDLDVYDFDQSRFSRELISSLQAGDYFVPTIEPGPILRLDDRFREYRAELALIIPEDFSERLIERDPGTIGLVVDGTNSNSAAQGAGYAGQIVRQFSQRALDLEPLMEVRYNILYNPEVESVYFMVPGIVATLLTMITIMLTSMSIVRERELGTLEQLVVTPIRGSVLLMGKLLPFAALGLLEMTVALTIGVLWFGVPFAGSPLLLLAMALLYLVTVLGLGLLFSVVTSTQQQAMFFAWFFSIFAMLTSGFFTPISNMPQWMQYVTYLNPMRFFMAVVRAIMMKGAGIADMITDVYPLAIYAVVTFGLASWLFVKRAD